MTVEGPRFQFSTLSNADLVVDAIYEGRGSGSVKDDPIAEILLVGNLGGFRCSGSVVRDQVRIAVLYTTGDEPDWPDSLDVDTGTFVYYGDNRKPGRQLHQTNKGGNLLLSKVFEATHATPDRRASVPPFLLFEKVPDSGRDVRFRGLLAPGSATARSGEDLVALWRTTRGSRFQNYRAIFTVLDVHTVSRDWIAEILSGRVLGVHCPQAVATVG